jgi:putative protease
MKIDSSANLQKNSHSIQHFNTQTELLLPVGNLEMALAAIHNGADAIFVGTPGFNARGRSYDHSLDELAEIIKQCHLHGVCVNLALNIVIFENELDQVAELLAKILPLKPDALIVQDLGLANLIRQMAPTQPIHASTQMTITNHDAIHFLDDLKMKRFVLGRENSLSEIKLIREQTDKELEVFVHGALCVSYSGQCFTSEAIGGRSANRGQCAQSCRFSYEMIVDGEKINHGDRNYLVSPQDLCGIAEIPELIDIGVQSFKIEGRLKTPEYVASAAQEYRLAIDKHFSQNDLKPIEIENAKQRMATTYSRGFYPGWLHGVNHQELVNGTYSNHRGYEIGRISKTEQNQITLELSHPIELSPGDGIKWSYLEKGQTIEGGAQIYSLHKVSAKLCKIELQRDIKIQNNFVGAKVYLNHDHVLKKNLLKSFTDKNQFKKIPVSFKIVVEINHPLKAIVSDGKNSLQLSSLENIEAAAKRGVEDSLIIEEFNALASTPFIASEITVERKNTEAIYIHHRIIKQLRRELCEQLMSLRQNQRVSKVETEVILEKAQSLLKVESKNQKSNTHTRLNIVLRDKFQVEDLAAAVLKNEISTEKIHAVILDFEFGRDYEQSLGSLRSTGLKVGIATTRILKPQEYNNLKALVRLNPDFILARNLGSIHYLQNMAGKNSTLESGQNKEQFKGEILGDFSLNVTNHLTADYLLNKNIKSVCLSYDLNHQQIAELMDKSENNSLEITAHQYIPSFHMEHCVFAAFLSKGSSYRDCGKPCERHRVELKDQFGNVHQIKADQECRNTMFNSISQSAAQYVTEWQNKGLGFIRYEALYEKGPELCQKVKAYIALLNHEKTAAQITQELRLNEKYGLGGGTIANDREYNSRKKTVADNSHE